MRNPLFIGLAGLLFGVGALAAKDPAPPALHRLYDTAPVSSTNPIIVRIKACGIEIPASEFRQYLAQDVSQGEHKVELNPAGKRKCLEGLIDEHLLLWDGYQRKAEQTEHIRQMMKGTLNILLEGQIRQKEVSDRAKTAAQEQELYRELIDRLWTKAEIFVSPEVYDEFKVTLKELRVDAISTNEPSKTVDLRIADLPPAMRTKVLARSKMGTVTIGEVLEFYAKTRPQEQPDLETNEGLSEILKQICQHALLLEEARAQGLESFPLVQEKLVLNWNTLVRFYQQDRMTDMANARMDEPGMEDRMKKWYVANLKTRYTFTVDGRKKVILLEGDEKLSIRNDYYWDVHEQVRAEVIASLRKAKSIQVNQRELDKMPLWIYRPAPPGDNAASLKRSTKS